MRRGRLITYCVGGAAIMLLSFSVTLWLTEPELPPAERIGLLLASAISDEASMNEAAQAAGLKNSPYIRGNIDAINRIDANRVGIAGWATETITVLSKGAPLQLMAFSKGKNILTTETRGSRPDVTAALALSPEAAKNVSFSATLSCEPGSRIVVVGVSVSGTYNGVGTRNCP